MDPCTPPAAKQSVQDNILATCVVAGVIGFIYPIYSRLGAMTDWQPFSPADAQAVTLSLLCGVGAIGAALGIDIKKLFCNLTGLFKGEQ